MTIEKALKVWHDSVGFNEIECSRALQESITVAFRSLEAWIAVKENLKRKIEQAKQDEYIEGERGLVARTKMVTLAEVIDLINRNLLEVIE